MQAGDDLARLIASAAPDLRDGDVIVIAQKVVSKAEGRLVALDSVIPGDEARRIGGDHDKDPRLVQVVLDETAQLIRAHHGVLICETHHGFVCANAGVDLSNAPGADMAILLPHDPDESARRIRAELAAPNEKSTTNRAANSPRVGDAAPGGVSPARAGDAVPGGASGARVGVIVADSFGRAWRLGVADVAIGAAGIRVLDDWRGRPDAHGRELRATEVAVADQLASAADLARAKDSGEPVVLIRGAEQHVTDEDGPGAAALKRPRGLDLFR